MHPPETVSTIQAHKPYIKIVDEKSLMIDKKIETLRSQDSNCNPGWVDVLGPVTSALNSSVCYGNNKLTPYKHVFTQDYDFKLGVQEKDKHNFDTIDDLNNYLPQRSTIEDCEVVSNTISNEINTSSSTSTPDKTNENLDNERFKVKSKVLKVSHNSQEKLSTLVVPSSIKDASDNLGRRVRRPYIHDSIQFVLSNDPNNRQLEESTKSYGFVYAELKNKSSCPFKERIVDPICKYSIGSFDYYKYCHEHPSRYWETDLITLFGTLQAASSSDKSIMFVDSNMVNLNPLYTIPKSINNKKYGDKNIFVSVLYKSTHYCVVLYDRRKKRISIFDGLFSVTRDPYAKQIWHQHILYLLVQVDTHTSINDVHVEVEDRVYNTNIVLKQEDSFNCGPIACVVLWNIFNSQHAMQCHVTLHKYTIRKTVIQELE